MGADRGASERIHVGPAGWSYQDWAGQVYPKPRPRGFDPLSYLAQYFDAVEINSTFYRIPDAKMTQRWVARSVSASATSISPRSRMASD